MHYNRGSKMMTEGGDDGDSSGGGYLAATPGDKNENQQVTIPDLKAEADEPQVSGDLPTTEGGGEVREVLYLNLENFDRDEEIPDDCPFVLTSPRSLQACKQLRVRVSFKVSMLENSS